MKETKHNEVDALLRSLARRERDESRLRAGSAAVRDSSMPSDHLDADELNSYAEGVVPPSARARYTLHLADCERCRRIVVGLTQSAGIAGRYEVPAQVSTGFWQTFAALFSPPVLRYGVPALVLTGVIAVGLLALRQPKRSEFVAQNEPQNAPAAQSVPNETQSQSNNGTPATREGSIPPPTSGDTKLAKQNAQPDKNNLGQVPAPVGAGSAKDSQPKNLLKSESSGTANSQPSFASEPAPPPAKPVLSDADTVARAEKIQPREAEERTRVEDRDQAASVSGANRGSLSSKAAAAPSSTKRIGDVAVGRRSGPYKEKKDSTDGAETRIVSGREFRRQGSAWIDTAYESSRATTSVGRGSEQYRSLVADEPGIRAIAETLGGEVIVIWKGRAYRIH